MVRDRHDRKPRLTADLARVCTGRTGHEFHSDDASGEAAIGNNVIAGCGFYRRVDQPFQSNRCVIAGRSAAASFPADALPALAAISGLVPLGVLRFPDSDSATGREAVHGSRSNLCPADAELTTARLNLSRADRKR